MNVKQGVRDLMQRQFQSRQRFINLLFQEIEVNEDEAQQIANLFSQKSLVKFEANSIGFKVEHGALLDKEVLLEALRIVKTEKWYGAKKKLQNKAFEVNEKARIAESLTYPE